MKKYWSSHELAEELQVSHSAVNKWIASGKIRSVKTPGGHNRIPLDEVERFKKEIGCDLEERS
jgi:excisionase family DNA binding protein